MKHQLRTYNTTVNILDHSPIKKKVKRKTKKYAELLAGKIYIFISMFQTIFQYYVFFITVTNNTATNKRTKVQKLKASDLSILVDDSDISANKLCDNKNFILEEQLNSNYINENCYNPCDTEIYLNIVSCSNLFISY